MRCVEGVGHQSWPARIVGAPAIAVELYFDAPPSFCSTSSSNEQFIARSRCVGGTLVGFFAPCRPLLIGTSTVKPWYGISAYPIIEPDSVRSRPREFARDGRRG